MAAAPAAARPPVCAPEADRLRKEADNALQARDRAGALKRLDSALTADKNCAPAWAAKGNVLCEAGRRAEGLQALDRALEADPGDGTARVTRGWCRERDGDHDGAEADFAELGRTPEGKRHGAYYASLLALAAAKAALAEAEEAAAGADEALLRVQADEKNLRETAQEILASSATAAPEDVRAARGIAEIFADDGESQKSPRKIQARQSGASRLKRKYAGERERLIKLVLMADPDFEAAWRDKADTESDPRQALADLEKAVALDPKDDRAWEAKGDVGLQLQDFRGAIADYGKAAALAPARTSLLLSRASAESREGRAADAVKDCRAAFKAPPPDASFEECLQTAVEGKDWDAAARFYLYGQRLSRRPDEDAVAFFARTIEALERSKVLRYRQEGALDHLASGLKDGRLTADVFVARARLELEDRSPKLALSDCEAALKRWPKNESALKCRDDAKKALAEK